MHLLSFWPVLFAVYCGQWEGDCCSARVERKIEGLTWRDGIALIIYLLLHLQAYPEIMADMFEAMTRQPAKRQRLNWEKLFWVKKTSDRWLCLPWPWTLKISILRSCLLCFSSLKVSFSRPALVPCRFRQCRNQLESPEEGLWIVVAHIFHVINLKKILLENKSYGKHWDIAC